MATAKSRTLRLANALLTNCSSQHGHAKANITGVDIFTGNKYMDVSPTSHTMSAPVGEFALPTSRALLAVA